MKQVLARPPDMRVTAVFLPRMHAIAGGTQVQSDADRFCKYSGLYLWMVEIVSCRLLLQILQYLHTVEIVCLLELIQSIMVQVAIWLATP